MGAIFKRNGFILFTFLFFVLLLTACSGNSETSGSDQSNDSGNDQEAQENETITIRLAGAQTPEHPMSQAAESFAEEVKEKSGGTIEGELYFGGVLGGEREMAEAVQLGNVEMGWISDIGLATIVPEIGFSYLPYLNTSYEEVENNYYNGWIGEEVKKRLSEKNLHVLGFMDNDFRWLSNSKRLIKTPEDLKDLSIRVPEIPELVQFFEELGALPTNMAVTEVVPALQQGTVDGQDNGAILNYTFGFYEFQPYMTITNHVFSGGAVVVNGDWWNSLSSDNQTIIQETAQKWVNRGNEELRANVENYTQKMRNEGVEIIEASDELVKAMEEAGRKVWENPENVERYGEEVMEKVLNQ